MGSTTKLFIAFFGGLSVGVGSLLLLDQEAGIQKVPGMNTRGDQIAKIIKETGESDFVEPSIDRFLEYRIKDRNKSDPRMGNPEFIAQELSQLKSREKQKLDSIRAELSQLYLDRYSKLTDAEVTQYLACSASPASRRLRQISQDGQNNFQTKFGNIMSELDKLQ